MSWDWWEVANGVLTILLYVGLMRLLGYRMTKVRGKHEVTR